MSAGVCGKRVGFEEIFGSTSPTAYSSAKRSRWSGSGSPIRSDFGSGFEDSLSILIQMFPALDAELVETVLRNHNNNIEDAIEALRTLSFGDARNRTQSLNSAEIGNPPAISDQSEPTRSQMAHETAEEVKDIESTIDCNNPTEGSKWVDMFVQEMMSAANLDDARIRAARILEAFEQSITARTRLEYVSLKEHLQSLLNDNQILKRAVAIQQERNLEQEEKTREVQQLKQMLNQYQEQLRSLELNNYTLKLHLQRAQENNSIPGQFHPDIF